MATGKVTTRSVEALRKQATREAAGLYLWDTELRGFGCRATPSGGLSWLFQHWVGGKGGTLKRIAYAQCPPMDIDDARKEAEKLRGDVNSGIDVVGRKAKLRIAKLEALKGAKLGDTFERYHKRLSEPGRYWEEIKAKFDNEIIPALGAQRLLAEISKQDIRSLIDAKEDAGLEGAARNLFAALRPFFKWCVERDHLTVSPLADLSSPPPPKKRGRHLSKDEIRSFWAATASFEYPFSPFYRLCLLTVQRREEVGGIRWDELNAERTIWTIPGARTKNGLEHIVHLSEQAQAVIATVPEVEDCPFLFSTTGDTCISGYSNAKERLDALMGIEVIEEAPGYDASKLWRLHDLRRTATTTLAELGISPDVADRLLNHVSGKTRDGVKGVYQLYEFLPERKRAIETWGNWVENLASNATQASNVVSFSR